MGHRMEVAYSLIHHRFHHRLVVRVPIYSRWDPRNSGVTVRRREFLGMQSHSTPNISPNLAHVQSRSVLGRPFSPGPTFFLFSLHFPSIFPPPFWCPYCPPTTPYTISRSPSIWPPTLRPEPHKVNLHGYSGQLTEGITVL